MIPPLTLFRYIFVRMMVSLVVIGGGVTVLIVLIDLLESLRLVGKFETGGAGLAFAITLLRTPRLAEALLPFIFLFAAMWTFAQLVRRSEIAVMRAAGLSAWRLIGPALAAAVLAGVFATFVYDPAAAVLMTQAERLKTNLQGGRANIVQVTGGGIWLRQRDAHGGSVILRAESLDAARSELRAATVWRLSADGAFEQRIDAPAAHITGGAYVFENPRLSPSPGASEAATPVSIPAALSADDLRQSAVPPDSLSVFELPRFIRLSEAAGLSPVGYQLRRQDLWSAPFKLIAMVLVAAAFSLRGTGRRGGVRLVVSGLGAGFGLYMASRLAIAFGMSGAVAPALAAWSPTIAAILLAATLLLHLEEG